MHNNAEENVVGAYGLVGKEYLLYFTTTSKADS